jgi:hypothetical protein
VTRKEPAIFIASFLVTVALGVTLGRMGQPIDPWRLLSLGLIALVFLNTVLFMHNLFKSLASVRGKSKKELEDIMEPALRGKMTQLEVCPQRIYRWITLICLGDIAGAVALLTMRHYTG